MTANKSNGVQPLVCCVCQNIVGVINTEALAQMLGAEDVYICRICAEFDETWIEWSLAEQPVDHYAHLISRALLAAELEALNVLG